MYIRAVHAIPEVAAVHELIQRNPLGLLTTGIASAAAHPFLQISHIPWVLDVEPGTGDLGTLRGHIARANPQSKAMVEAVQAADSFELADEVLVLFQAPHHAYVTPKSYVATKPTTGKVVPTWNYEAAQAYGRLTLFFANDDRTGDFLAKQIRDLSQQNEEAYGHKGDEAWKVEDAPAGYIKQLKRAIVGLEIKIARLEGKSKMSQEEPLADREGVAAGFRSLGTDLGDAMADSVTRRSAEREAAMARAP
ncbi:hypothetical protein JCM10450v2_008209 [Rhodotorula kratochvilovae]